MYLKRADKYKLHILIQLLVYTVTDIFIYDNSDHYLILTFYSLIETL